MARSGTWLCIAALAAACRPPATPRPADEPVVRDALYFVLVDRFEDGVPDAPGTVDPADPQGWHGGDLAGVQARLPWLESLGVGAVWLSPITAAQDAKVDEWGAFHAYWVEDHRAMERRFGTVEDARALSEALHARGLRLYLDMVWNHVGYGAPLTEAHPEWFHGRGDVVDWDDRAQAETHDVHGLPDLAQELPAVHAYLHDASVWWLDAVQPDGFRVDAVRHLPAPFVARIGAELRAAHPGFALLGEHFEGDPYRLAERFRETGVDAVFDFPMHYAMKDVFCADAPVGRLAATLATDRAYGDPESAPGLAHLVPFLDNHDVPRVASVCGGDLDRVARALAFLLTTRGTPCLYQGTEVGQLGAEEPANRADMVFDPDHPLVATTRGLLDLRARHRALREGATRLEALEPGRLLYSRLLHDRVARVAVNLTDTPWVPGVPPDQAALTTTGAWVVTGAGAPQAAADTAVPPGGIRVDLAVGDAGPATAALAASRSRRVAVELHAAALPVEPGDRVLLVGAGEALGRWTPADGVAAVADGAGWTWHVEVPEGDVLAFKVVLDGPGGTRWSPGADRFVWARADAGAHPVAW